MYPLCEQSSGKYGFHAIDSGVIVNAFSRGRKHGTGGHEVFSVYDLARGMDDDEIVRKAFDENWILITNDKDFGEQVYRERKPHHGIVLLRLADGAGQIEDRDPETVVEFTC